MTMAFDTSRVTSSQTGNPNLTMVGLVRLSWPWYVTTIMTSLSRRLVAVGPLESHWLVMTFSQLHNFVLELINIVHIRTNLSKQVFVAFGETEIWAF